MLTRAKQVLAGARRRGGTADGSRRAGMRIGLTIGRGELTAVEVRRTVRGPRPGATWAIALDDSGEGSVLADLPRALAELRSAVGARAVTVGIALLRPLAHGKVVSVPPVGRREAGPLVLRSARRYFAIGAEPVLADAQLLEGRRSEARLPALAVCAPEQLIESLVATISAAGFRVDGVAPASVALTEALRVLVPKSRRGRLGVLASGSDWREVMLLDAGAPRVMQPVTGGAGMVASAIADELTAALRAAAEPHGGATRLVVVGCDDAAESLRSTPVPAGPRRMDLLRARSLRGLPPAVVAAFGAAVLSDDAPVLLPEADRQARTRRARRRTGSLWVATACILAVAAALRLWGAEREREAVETRRREIAPAVAKALADRRAADGVRTTLETVLRLQGTAPRWTATLAALTEALPDSAHLVSFAASGGQLRVRVVASSAQGVVPALESSPEFAQVAFFTPPEHDEGSGFDRADVTAALASGLLASGAAVRGGAP